MEYYRRKVSGELLKIVWQCGLGQGTCCDFFEQRFRPEVGSSLET